MIHVHSDAANRSGAATPINVRNARNFYRKPGAECARSEISWRRASVGHSPTSGGPRGALFGSFAPVAFRRVARPRRSAMDPVKYDRTSECALILVTSLYSASLIVSAEFRNNYSWIKTCHPFIPFGECIISGGALEETWPRLLISFVVALLAGTAWSRDRANVRAEPKQFRFRRVERQSWQATQTTDGYSDRRRNRNGLFVFRCALKVFTLGVSKILRVNRFWVVCRSQSVLDRSDVLCNRKFISRIENIETWNDNCFSYDRLHIGNGCSHVHKWQYPTYVS